MFRGLYRVASCYALVDCSQPGPPVTTLPLVIVILIISIVSNVQFLFKCQ